jgi:hypothetical protein
MSINFEIYKDQDEYQTGISEQTLMNLLKMTLSLSRNYLAKIIEVVMVNWRFDFTNIRCWWKPKWSGV